MERKWKKRKGEEKDVFHRLDQKKLREERKCCKWSPQENFLRPHAKKTMRQERNVINFHICSQMLLSINTEKQKSKKGD